MRFIFGDYVLDPDRRELWCGGEAVHVEPQVLDLLLHLIRNPDRVVSKDELLSAVWQGRIISESTISNRINAARRAIGDNGKSQRLIRTVARKGFRFIGQVEQELDDAGDIAAETGTSLGIDTTTTGSGPPSPEITFCRTADDVNLAVAASGNGSPLVKTANWLNHLEYDWRSPVWSPMLRLFAARFRLLRYDERGTGLSDWHVPEISFEGFVRDLETVVDQRGLDRFALLGISQGAAVAIAYAAHHPDRVSRLVICGGYATGWRKRADADEIARREGLTSLIRHGWGQDNPAFRQVFTSLLMPDATAEQMQSFNELERRSTSPENAVRLANVFAEIDVSELLERVTAPTLVLHSRDDASIPFEQGLRLARSIPNARFVALDSRNHLVLSHEQAWDRYMEEVCAFLDPAAPSPLQSSVTV